MSKLSTLKQLLLCLLMVGMSLPAYSVSSTERELQIKAAYLYNFTKFITWTDSSLSKTDDFTFCIVEDEYFTHVLTQIVKARTISNKTPQIKTVSKTDTLTECHLIYIPQQTTLLNEFYLKKAVHTQSLTVGENLSFTQLGGIIRFYTKNNKLKFEINNPNAINAGLKIQSQLLKLGNRSIDE